MLVCPQCQFENPNTNKFCQRCGTSLVHKTCQECGTPVPIDAQNCHKCGAFTGTVWQAIIFKEPDALTLFPAEQAASLESLEPIESNAAPIEASQLEGFPSQVAQSSLPLPETNLEAETPTAQTPDLTEDTDIQLIDDEATTQPLSSPLESNLDWDDTPDNSVQDERSSPIPTAIYLDNQQRYRLLDPQNLDEATTGQQTQYGVSVRVLDSQPFQKTLLEALLDRQGGSQAFDPRVKQSPNVPSDAQKVLGIPAIAQPYLALKGVYYQTLPAVHDAWSSDGEAVILLEDRSEWSLIADLWDSEQLDTLQILFWLAEMAKLWEALEPWHCRQSLLERTNLRVDEDQALGLGRLYLELKDRPLTLQDLGQMWQTLFDQSQRTQFTALSVLFRQMSTGEIATMEELRSQLEAIAHEHQTFVMQATPPDYDMGADPTVPSVAAEDSRLANLPRSYQEATDADGEPTVILPMQLLSLDDAACTDIGQREHNEDSFGIQTLVKKKENPMGRSVEGCGLYVLCDGMGGHASGEVASGMAVETIKRYFQENWFDSDQLPSEGSVREAVRLANQAIYEVNQKNARSGSGRMGTTLAMMLIQNTNAIVAHVGDSRLYRLTRKRGLEQLTIDHEVGQREIKRGVDPADAYHRPDAYQLTQALGPRSDQFVNPDVQFLELNEDTLFILCSDGLSDNDLIETHWQTHLAPLLSSRANLDQGILQLIELANELNGHDNITAILIRVKVRPNFDQQQLLYK
jgi:protein phosphatase